MLSGVRKTIPRPSTYSIGFGVGVGVGEGVGEGVGVVCAPIAAALSHPALIRTASGRRMVLPPFRCNSRCSIRMDSHILAYPMARTGGRSSDALTPAEAAKALGV